MTKQIVRRGCSLLRPRAWSQTASRLALLPAMMLAVSCEQPAAPSLQTGSTALAEARIEPIQLRRLSRAELWDWPTSVANVPPLEMDSTGVPLSYPGGAPSRQPVSIATVGILMLANSELLNRPVMRDTVEYWVRTLVSEAEKPDGAIIFPYNFSFYLHGLAQEQNDAPWYSALAQGEFLELLTRLYVSTGKPEYLDWAKRVFRPFVDVRPYSENHRSVAHIDGSGYYWADEYPNKGRPDLTLNGYMYAIRGVYEYWLLTGDPDAERVVRAAMTTFKRYHQQYRAPGGGPSSYCLRHPQIVSGPYHRQIVLLFQDYYRMSGDAVFSNAAADFKSDYWPE